MLYHKCTNISTCPEVASSNILNAGKIYNIEHWVPPPIVWIKYNTDTSKSKATQAIVISYVSRDTTGRFIHKNERKIENQPILVRILIAETLAIRNTLTRVIQEKYPKAIIKNDSLIAIQAINGKPKPPT